MFYMVQTDDVVPTTNPNHFPCAHQQRVASRLLVSQGAITR